MSGLNVLFIGNSYTTANDLPGTVQALVASRGGAMRHETIARGGALLHGHLAEGVAAARIRSGAFTHVVLQEQSQLPAAAPPVFIEAACALAGLASAAGAKPVLFVTWAPRDAPQEQAKLTASYEAVARRTGALLAPVGPTWAKVPRLLFSGLHGPDGRHPAPMGTYLAALVLFKALTGKAPVELPVRLDVSDRVATELQLLAAATDS
jgi:hypothetical protein